MKKSLITVFAIFVVFVALKLFAQPFFVSSPWYNQALNVLYLWSPGFVGLYFAKRDNLKLPIFKNLKWGFVLIPLYTMVIVVVGFLLSFLFGLSFELNTALFGADLRPSQQVGWAAILLFSSYIFPMFFLGILFLGGEIFWRGYLWEKLKKPHPFKAIWVITLLWIIWQLPLTYFSYTPGFESNVMNLFATSLVLLVISPILFYFRLKYRSLLASTLFYTSLYGAFWVPLVFQKSIDTSKIMVYGACDLAVLALFFFAFKLYSPKKWEKGA